MLKLNFEKNNQETVDIWRDLLKEAMLAGCEEGLKGELSNADWEISKEQPAEIKNYPRLLINKFALGKATIWELHADFSREDYPPQLFIEAWGGDIIKTLIFQNKKDEYFDLNQLAPAKSYFIREKYFGSGLLEIRDERHYIIIYNENLLKKSGGFLSFLHEIGHARIKKGMDTRIVKNINKLVTDAKFLSTTELLDKYSGEERGILLQHERDAWAWSIKTIRELRKQGIDLVLGLNKEEIKKWVYDKMRLSSYECGLDITPYVLRDIRKEKLEFLKNEKK